MPEALANPTNIPGMTCSIVASVNIVDDAFCAEGDFINITTDPIISAIPTSTQYPLNDSIIPGVLSLRAPPEKE